MGNTKIAGGYNYNGFVSNPALLARVKPFRLSVFNLPVMVNKQFTDATKFISDNQDKFEDYDDLTSDEKAEFLKDIEEYDGEWSRIRLAPMIDVAFSIPAGYSFGLALYNTSTVSVKIDRGIYEPRVWGHGISNFVGVLGVARDLSLLTPGLTVGANLKAIQRRTTSEFQIKATDLGDAADILEPILDEAEENKTTTFAADFGALYDVPIIDSEVAATFQSIGDGRGSSFDIGISKRFFDDRLILLADFIDFFDNNRQNYFKKLHIGGEYHPVKFVFLRAGLNSGYPAAGLGLDFKLVDLDVAYFTEELSAAPGGEEDERVAFQLKLGW
jgi:hypothetical protein